MRWQPGDVLFTRGRGFTGWHIRHGSAAFYAHCEILHGLVSETDGVQRWLVSSALYKFRSGKSGLRWRERVVDLNGPERFLAVRVWRDETERLALLDASRNLTNRRLKYGLDSIVAIALWGLGLKRRLWFNPKSVICSEAVMECVCQARRDLALGLPFPPRYVWPGLAREHLAIQPGVEHLSVNG